MLFRIVLFISLLGLIAQQVSGQVEPDDFEQIIQRIVMDKELNGILYSYDYFGDHPLFIVYNDAVIDVMDTSNYVHLVDWKYQINLEFSGNRVYIRNLAFLFSRNLKYYLQFDEIIIGDNKAKVRLRTNTMDQRIDNLFYLRAKLI